MQDKKILYMHVYGPAMQQSSCYEAAEELLKLQLAEQLN
jgi:hypothetical protein